MYTVALKLAQEGRLPKGPLPVNKFSTKKRIGVCKTAGWNAGYNGGGKNHDDVDF